jgi:hypothetical protein
VFTKPLPAGPAGKRRDQVIYYQNREGRARRTLRGIDEQITKAEKAVAGKTPVKRNRFIRLSGGTRGVNRALEAKARALAGLKGYVTNLSACPRRRTHHRRLRDRRLPPGVPDHVGPVDLVGGAGAVGAGDEKQPGGRVGGRRAARVGASRRKSLVGGTLDRWAEFTGGDLYRSCFDGWPPGWLGHCRSKGMGEIEVAGGIAARGWGRMPCTCAVMCWAWLPST